ncbi:MAG: SDR family NAD(P)-dependent oxidoreductase, partial [Undibacterium sp.]|nr:SDR family NAD(P)-dependent oxidoreductase [Opitutaceae bacterium]
HLAAHPGLALPDVCHTANTGRTAGPHRAALAVTSSSDLVARLRALTPEKFPAAARVPLAPPAVALLFTGQGSHHAGMARELYDTQPDFRATIHACAALFAPLLPTPLTAALFAADDTLLGQTLYAQPALFAVELALGRLWLSWGMRPAGIFGHSIGEYAAACLAGVFSLEDAARLVAAKARLTHGLPADGAMLATAASPKRLAPHLAAHSEVEIAAFNGPSATTLAGPAPAITRLLAALESAGIGAQRLPIAQAFHSRALDPILAEFAAVAESVTYHAPTLPFVTCLHGRVADAEVATARYWVRQMREPVQFTRGVETLARDLGCTAFLELGPRPSLTSLGQTAFSREERAQQLWLPSLRPGRSDWAVMLAALGELYTHGVSIDWAAFDGGYARRRLSALPTYAFQRRRYWLEVAPRPAPPSLNPAPVAAEPISTFSVHWHETPPPARSEATGEWWLISTDTALTDALTAALSSRQQSVRRLAPGAPLPFGSTPPCGVIAVGAPSEVIALARRIIDPALPASPLWIITQHAVATGRELAPLNLAAAPLTGFARAFALEHSAHWGGLLDIDEITPTSVSALTGELLAASHDDFVVWRKSARLVPRLLPHALGAVESAPISDKKTHLITGGTGGLGLAIARWLIPRGARHIALMSRRASAPELAPALAEFAAAGVNVRALAGDVTVAADVARVLAQIETESPSLGGVFHAAGIAGFEPLATLTPENFSAVLAPKITGARHLHDLTRDRALDHFVLFSSISSVWGSHGQTHYAAGNAFLDTLAHERHRLGLPALSVNWGPWDDVGMASPTARDQLRRIGLSPLPPADATHLLGRLMANGAAQVTAAQVDWSLLRPVLTLRRPRPLPDAFAPAPGTAGAAKPVSKSDILPRLRAA